MSFINTIREDIKTVQAQDPAAQNGLVIFLSYPGLHAKWNHVPEHWLWEHGHRSLARVLSQITRHITGVEIHPAAQIGKHFFIDHAMGVVIGETTIVGDNCVLYQGVTLGGTGNETGNVTPPRQQCHGGHGRQGARQHLHRQQRQDRRQLGRR